MLASESVILGYGDIHDMGVSDDWLAFAVTGHTKGSNWPIRKDTLN